MNREDEDAATFAAAMVIVWYNCHQAQQKKRSVYRPPSEYVQHSFSLKLMPPGRARIWLRFTPEEIRQLVPLLNLEEVSFWHRYKADPETAFCVVVAHLSFPNRWEHLVDLFGRSKTWLSIIFNDVILFLAVRFSSVLLWHSQLTYSRLKVFADAIHKIDSTDGVWGFVDGTF